MNRQVNIVREGRSSVNWDTGAYTFRKPKTFVEGTINKYKYVQAKCDGHRVIIAKEANGELAVITTSGVNISHQCEYMPWFAEFNSFLLRKTFVDAELTVTLQGAETIKTRLIAKEPVDCRVFACSWLNTEESLATVQQEVNLFGVLSPYNMKLTGDNFDTEEIEAPGYDGVIFKTGMYGQWAKLKSRKTIDCVVTGLTVGFGKNFGKIGALRCSVYRPDGKLIEICNCSGMTDAVRNEITMDDVGRVVEVAYERVGTQGRLRHPRFIRWREDKLASQCLAEQDTNLC